jgi:hypothetical protein
MFPSSVIRFIPKENRHMLPGHAVVLHHHRSGKRVGLLKVEIPFRWIKNHTVMYERLMGRVDAPR